MTTSPDVAVSTNLGGWINQVGVFAAARRSRLRDRERPRLLRWEPGPTRPAHRAGHLGDEPVHAARPARACRPSCAASSCCRSAPSTTRSSAAASTRSIYGLYSGAQLRLRRHARRASRWRPRAARTSRPSPPSLGIELPNLLMLRAVLRARGRVDAAGGAAPVLRPRARALDLPAPLDPADRPGAADAGAGAARRAELRRQVLAGGYRLVDGAAVCPEPSLAARSTSPAPAR